MNIRYMLWEPWEQAFNFKGRARRREVVIFAAQFIFLSWLTTVIGGEGAGVKHASNSLAGWASLLLGIVLIGAMVPALSIQVRRLHDIGRSGWWLLFGHIPLIGHLFMLFAMFWPGDAGANNFGANPRLASSSVQLLGCAEIHGGVEKM